MKKEINFYSSGLKEKYSSDRIVYDMPVPKLMTNVKIDDGLVPDDECSGDNKDVSPEDLVKQWSDMDGCIIPVSNTFSLLEPGYYSIGYSNQLGMYLQKQEVELNKLYRLPNEASNILLNDIDKFWTLEDTYKRYHRVFRRNYLLYSSPGTGKTSLINLMCQDLIKKYDGIVISLTCSDEIKMYTNMLQRIRKIEPNRKIITVIEDIDNFIGDPFGNGNSSLDTHILNTLDGNLKVGGVVTIATTNYIEKVAGRYKNRPSRFDRVVEFPLPNRESREMFIKMTVMPEDLEKIDIDRWVDHTEGYSIDHLNELILMFFVFNHSEEESFETMDKMVKNNDNLKNVTSERKKSAMGYIKGI